jgi:transposase
MVDRALGEMSPLFDEMYSELGRPSIAPEKLLRAQLLQMLYSVRSERLLMEEIDYSVLFRWFVGMNMDEPVWDVTVFTKNRDRLLEHNVAKVFFAQVWQQAELANLTSTSISPWTVRCWRRGESEELSEEGRSAAR